MQHAMRSWTKKKRGPIIRLAREQTNAVLRLQLSQLTRYDKGKLEEEKATLEASREEL